MVTENIPVKHLQKKKKKGGETEKTGFAKHKQQREDDADAELHVDSVLAACTA